MTNTMTEKMRQKRRKKDTLEKFLVCAIIGAASAIGILAAFAVLTASDAVCFHRTASAAVYVLLFASITGILFFTD